MKLPLILTTLMLAPQALAGPLSVDFKVDFPPAAIPISPYIYGINGPSIGPYTAPPFRRSGGNRMTAYNWTTNDSNAGADWHYQNDSLLSKTTTPGDAVAELLAEAHKGTAGVVITIPIVGYVSADRRGDGDVRCLNGDAGKPDHNYLHTRFKPSLPSKGKPFTTNAATLQAAPSVYQDEFINWVNVTYAHPKAPIWYCLDNEPDLWNNTHAEIHPAAVTYAELLDKSIAYATAIKNVAPKTKVFGPVSYGWAGYTSLQHASDSGKNGDFLTYYIDRIAAAGKKSGKRLVDVLDLHWYTEAQGGGARVSIPDAGRTGKALTDLQNARMQSPRSLWDPTYTESSWISQWETKGPIQLLPLEQAKLRDAAKTYGPEFAIKDIAFTEYNYGGGDDISGAIAQADVLGIFGKYGVLAANEWGLTADESFIGAGFRMFRNFDGSDANFGDISLPATTTDVANTSIYASTDSAGPGRLVLVLINKTDAANPSDIIAHITFGRTFTHAEIYRLTNAGVKPVHVGGQAIHGDTADLTLPGDSISTVVLTGEP